MTDHNSRLNDSDIRAALRVELRFQHAAIDRDALIIDELPICRHAARTELAVIKGDFAGFEIKGARDNLHRLAHQKDAYNRVFDFVTIVAT